MEAMQTSHPGDVHTGAGHILRLPQFPLHKPSFPPLLKLFLGYFEEPESLSEHRMYDLEILNRTCARSSGVLDCQGWKRTLLFCHRVWTTKGADMSG
jgi:hypothetical protein